MITSLIILSSLLIIFGYISYNLFQKNIKLEIIAHKQLAFIDSFQAVINETDEKLQGVDEKGAFQADDEIGFFFAAVKSLQEALNDYKSDNN